MGTVASLHQNKEREAAWLAFRFFQDLAQKTEHYHRIFGLISVWKFKAEYQSPLRLNGNTKEPPALDSLFWIYGKFMLGRTWIPVLSVRFLPAELGHFPLSPKVQLRIAKKKKRIIRDLCTCEIHRASLVAPRTREHINRFVQEMIGNYEVRYFDAAPEGPACTGKALVPYLICR